MDRLLYRDHQQQEESHWWFVGRRRVVAMLLKTLRLNSSRRLLDVGSGAGGMLELLLTYGQVTSLEGDAECAEHIRERYGERVTVLPHFFESLDPTKQTFDVVSMFDVLEHIEDDVAALKKIHALLVPGGWYIATVPACPFLWSSHDDLNKHYRRYMKRELCQKVEQAGFTIARCSYFNFFLFVPIFFARMLFRLIGRVDSDVRAPSAGVNGLFAKIFSFERFCLSRFSFPIGVSLFIIAKKNV